MKDTSGYLVMKELRSLMLVFGMTFPFLGCATEMVPLPASLSADQTIVFGEIQTSLTGPTTRWYAPQVRFFELMNHTTEERFRVDVEAADSPFFLALAPGEYELVRVQINEGAFRSMAQLNSTFQVRKGGLNYLGKWEVKVHPPTYLRLIDVSVETDLEDAKAEVRSLYPDLAGLPIHLQIPTPKDSETRLVEISPYPRVWWFCRHLTC
ncbi:MAG: hypothetical protein NPIRA03_39900 [Nitrospirales bacterium]|nr:MAG: hypothetical protein NPIRA03_39900 [Nitrospirales bacterium]